MTVKVRPTAIEEGSRQNVDLVKQSGSHLRPSARPGLFDHLNDPCISIFWSGPLEALMRRIEDVLSIK